MRCSSVFSLFAVFVLLTACITNNDQDRGVDRSSRWSFPPYQGVQNPEGESIETVQGDGSRLIQKDSSEKFGATGAQPYVRGKVAILLPLSGGSKDVGQALLQSAQLALFDMKQNGVTLVPIDTNGTAMGAARAIQKAASEKADIVLGPLFASSVAAAGQEARRHNLNVIGFTTDWTKAGDNVFTLGILPFDQGMRLAQYTSQVNKKRVVILSPNTKYANAVVSSFETVGQSLGVRVVQKIYVGSDVSSVNMAVQRLVEMDKQFDAILMPVGNPGLSLLANALNDRGLTPTSKLWLGTGTWDDDRIKTNPAMRNAFFAAPAPALRHNFERNYQSLYGVKPPRLASLSYDATALAITLLSQPQAMRYQSLVNPNGFAGIDGIFRLQKNGLAQRGLAIHKIVNGQSVIASQAPNSFLTK